MKYYRHTITMREQLLLERRKDRIQNVLDFLKAVLAFTFIYLFSVWVLA